MILSACNDRHIAADKVPSIVRNVVVGSYPELSQVDWEKYQNYYEAEANLNDSTELNMQISQSGALIMQKQDIGIEKLPAQVIAYLNANYKAYVVDDAEQVERNTKTYYQLELTSTGKRDIHLVITTDGKPERNVSFWD